MYAVIDRRITTDPWFDALSDEAQRAFFLLILESQDACGTIVAPLRRLASVLRLGTDRTEAVLAEMDKKVKWYPEYGVVWIVSYFKYQHDRQPNPSFVRAAYKATLGLPESIQSAIWKRYPEIANSPNQKIGRPPAKEVNDVPKV